MDHKKMSKSIGNVVDPFDCLNKYTKNGLRYFLLREGVPASDCNMNMDNFTKFINVELANTLGNLYQRCLPFNKGLNYPSYNQVKDDLSGMDKELLECLDKIKKECDEHFEVFNFYHGIQSIMGALRMTNILVQEYKPWELIKSKDLNDLKKVEKMLYLVYESLRVVGILLQPIVPDLAEDLLDRLNVNKAERFYEFAQVDYNQKESKKILNKANVIFKRL